MQLDLYGREGRPLVLGGVLAADTTLDDLHLALRHGQWRWDSGGRTVVHPLGCAPSSAAPPADTWPDAPLQKSEDED